MSETLPFAHVTQAVALQHADKLVVVVTGKSRGFDGLLRVVPGIDRRSPPSFQVLELPGTCGITGECPPDREVTVAQAFDMRLGELRLITAKGVQTLKVVHVEGVESGAAGPERPPSESHTHEDSDEWAAYINAMPPGAPRLIVVGRVYLPTPGYQVTLKRLDPQGINPRVLLLDLDTVPPSGNQAQVITAYPVRYTEAASLGQFTHVSIVDAGITIPVTGPVF